MDIKLLKKLTETFGPAGRETKVAEVVKKELDKMGLKPKKDTHGTVTLKLGSGGKKILLAAHMDEIGVVVNYVDRKGFLKVTPVG